MRDLLALHNAARAEALESRLRLDDRCVIAARLHAMYMAKEGRLTHRGEGGSTPGDRLRDAGYRWVLVGENIAFGYSSPADVFSGWMGSPGHKRNILDGEYQDVGFGYADRGTTRYWCAVFARSSQRTVHSDLVIDRCPEGLKPKLH